MRFYTNPVSRKYDLSRQIKTSRPLVFLLVFYGLFSWSPIFAHFGARGSVATACVIVATILIRVIEKRRLEAGVVFILVTSVVFAVFSALYWGNARVVFLPIYFVAALLLVSVSNREEIGAFVDVSSVIILILLVGAIVGFILVGLGVPSIWEFANPDGRNNALYWTTLSNDRVGSMIRPSGIYDEPGAFSFVICVIAYMRQALDKGLGLTWLLLLLGFITLSLAHFVFFMLILASERVTPRRLLALVSLFFITILTFALTGFETEVQDKLVARMEITDSGVAGDNRSHLMERAFELIQTNPNVLLFGLDASCVFDADSCIAKHGAYIANPLSPIVNFGLIVAWPYYLLLGSTLYYAMRGRRNLGYLAVGILLLQRPFLMTFGYSLLGVLAAWVQVKSTPRSTKVMEARPVRKLWGPSL